MVLVWRRSRGRIKEGVLQEQSDVVGSTLLKKAAHFGLLVSAYLEVLYLMVHSAWLAQGCRAAWQGCVTEGGGGGGGR